jgi:predicted DNA-binding transcriptional regulator YafY
MITKERAARLAKLLRLLEGGNIVTSTWLANKLDVSQRAIHRDLRELRNDGVRIGGSAGRGGGLMLRPERRRA